MRRTPPPPSPVMEALRALERAQRKAQPEQSKTPTPPRATGGKTKKASQT